MNFIASKKDVENFLEGLHNILDDKEFDIQNDLYLIVTDKNKITEWDMHFPYL